MNPPPSGIQNKKRITIFPDLKALDTEAAELFMQLCAARLPEKGYFTVALSGGSTPRSFYKLLAAPYYKDKIPWNSIHFYWSDERCVPATHPDSNYGMSEKALLLHVPVPPQNVHRIRGELDPRQGAGSYEKEIRDAMRGTKIPSIDLILLGLGKDGHTASIFPFSHTLKGKDRLVMLDINPETGQERITMTLPMINQASTVLFLVSGKEKAEILSQVFNNPIDPNRFPAQGVNPPGGDVYWYVDEDAASLL